jgi:hypothetical protein
LRRNPFIGIAGGIKESHLKKKASYNYISKIANFPTTVFAQGHQSVGCRAKAKAFENTRSGF